MSRLKNKSKQLNIFIWIFAFVLMFYNLASRTNSYNTTLLAFSYKYGFIPRGFVGNIYQCVNSFTSTNLNTYNSVNRYTKAVTVIFVVALLVFISVMIKSIMEEYREEAIFLMVFLVIMVVPSFAGYYNFGRVDLYIVALSLLAVTLIVKNKALWLLVPIVAVCECIHEGYVFMYFNVVLALLAIKIVDAYLKKDKSFGMIIGILVICVLTVSGLFLWFRLSSPAGQAAYQSIKETAASMCYHNKPHVDVIKAEILGVDLTASEKKYRKENVIELIAFVVLFAPFICILVGFIKRANSMVSSKFEKHKYVILALGGLTTLPLFILKVDYGRWVLALIMYYTIAIIALIASKDRGASEAWADTVASIKTKYRFGILLLPYAMLFSPFCDLSIGKLMYLVYSLVG